MSQSFLLSLSHLSFFFLLALRIDRLEKNCGAEREKKNEWGASDVKRRGRGNLQGERQVTTRYACSSFHIRGGEATRCDAVRRI